MSTRMSITVIVLVISLILIGAIPFFIAESEAKESEKKFFDSLSNEELLEFQVKLAAATGLPKDTLFKEVDPEYLKRVLTPPEVIKYEPVEPYEFILLPEDLYDFEDLETNIAIMAQTIYGEARDMSTYEMSLVAWCICNRVDDPHFPSTIEEVIKQKGQFHGYSADKPIEKRCYDVAKDVIIRWNMESQIIGNVGRTLPKEYLYFYGKDGHNKYRVKNDDPNGRWDFTDILPNPYE